MNIQQVGFNPFFLTESSKVNAYISITKNKLKAEV